MGWVWIFFWNCTLQTEQMGQANTPFQKATKICHVHKTAPLSETAKTLNSKITSGLCVGKENQSDVVQPRVWLARTQIPEIFLTLKVAEHSFSTCFSLSTNMAPIQPWFYFIHCELDLVLFSFRKSHNLLCKTFVRSVCQKKSCQRGSSILCFTSSRENPVKCSACAVNQKLETGNFGVFLWEIRCFLRNRLIEFYEIWQENTLANR